MNGLAKAKLHIHCFLTNGSKQKHIRINRNPHGVGDDYILGVDFMGEVGERIGMDDLMGIARYMQARIESIESVIVMPGDDLIKAPIITHNRASRRIKHA